MAEDQPTAAAIKALSSESGKQKICKYLPLEQLATRTALEKVCNILPNKRFSIPFVPHFFGNQ